MMPRTVFMGSPEFALPTLKALAERYPVVGVVTQPDRPAGRGNVLTPPPVKVLAQQLGLEVFQPEKLRTPEAKEKLRSWNPDLIVVAAFGQILRQEVLDLPPFGCINVHASLLPRWRGASPIQAAILHGDTVTGVTIMKMDAGIDTGPILAQRAVTIQPEDTAGSLSERLAQEGASLLMEVLPDYLEGRLHPQPQPEEGATYAKMLSKEEGNLRFEESVHQLVNRVRAYHPWPSAYTFWNGQMLKIHRARAVEDSQSTPGQRRIIEGYPAIGTSDGWLLLLEVQPAGKRAMDGKDFLRGARTWSEV